MFLRRRLMVFLGMCLLAMSVSYCGNTKGNGAGAKCTSLDDCDQELKLECRAGKCRPAIVNRKPIAKIRLRDSNYEVGDTIELDGRSSADPDDDLLSYKWSLKEAPEGSKAKLNDAGKTLAKLRADKAGKYVFELIVSDGTLSSEAVLSTVDVDFRINENLTANVGDDQVVAPKAKV